MKSVVFVCLGNICRSPMAELIFKRLVKERGLDGEFDITSCGTSHCEVGNPIYPPAKRTLEKHGISGTHTARQILKSDIVNNDYIVVMDESNLSDVLRLAQGYEKKVKKLLSFAGEERDVSDPWYTLNFEKAYSDIYLGCTALLEHIQKGDG